MTIRGRYERRDNSALAAAGFSEAWSCLYQGRLEAGVSDSAAITRVSAGVAIARERDTRHWTIEQRREAFGEDWPSESARITREADEAVDFLVEALDGLRSAWNAHFKTCPTPTSDLPAPSWEDLQRWRDAPSGTASA